MLFVCLIHSQMILDPSILLGSFSINSKHISQSIEVILCALYQLDSSSTASRFVKTFLHALFFTCFASFYYLIIHSILFHYIHAFIWIIVPLSSSLIVFMFLGWSFIASCILCQSWQKKGREFGFFLRFYMLGGEIHAFVRGSCVSSCYGECLHPYCFRNFF